MVIGFKVPLSTKYIALALLSLADIPSMCGFQVKCSSNFTPRYFTEFVGYNH